MRAPLNDCIILTIVLVAIKSWQHIILTTFIKIHYNKLITPFNISIYVCCYNYPVLNEMTKGSELTFILPEPICLKYLHMIWGIPVAILVEIVRIVIRIRILWRNFRFT